VYYERGRNLAQADLQQLFRRFKDDAGTIYPKVEQEIREQAQKLDVEGLLAKIRT
jgi:hypothetical protein